MINERMDLVKDLRSRFGDDEKVLRMVAPFIERVADLRLTVSTYYPHWLTGDQLSPFGHDDFGLKEEYQRFDSLITSAIFDLNASLESGNIVPVAQVAGVLLDCNTDTRYAIKLGNHPVLMSVATVSELGRACAQCVLEPDTDVLAQAVISALTNIVDRMNIYLDPIQ